MAGHTDERDSALLARAVTLAHRSPLIDPNPRVGAVIAQISGARVGVVGEGWHLGAGTPHAEVEALRAAGSAARGAVAYVSLEPCNHVGRTGPCTRALIEAGVARVVYAVADPTPLAGGGATQLREHGVEVEFLPDADAEEVNRTWLFAARTGRAFLTWKFAATLDGRCAAADATSQWITSEEARADVHRLRAGCGAIIAGTGTVLADDPHLTARHADGSLLDRQPLRVVVGRRHLPVGAHVLDTEAPTVTTAAPLPEVLADLWHRGIHHAFLEGGPTLAAGFVRAGLVDEVVAYLAPALLGSGSPAVGDLGIASMADIRRFDLTDLTQIGPDVRLTLTSPRAHEEESHVHRNR